VINSNLDYKNPDQYEWEAHWKKVA
jgi:hypothetical protein